MADFEDELLQDAEDDARTVEYIKTHLPQELKDKFSEEELYYFLDSIVEYYAESGKDGCIEIDMEAIAQHMVKQAKKDKMGDYDADDLRWIVEAEMDYAEQQE